MELENKKRTGFFDQIIYSVQPQKYKKLVELPVRKVVFYILLLGLCLSIMDYVIPAAGWMTSFGGVDHFITKVLPDIEFNQGELHTEGVIEIGKESTSHLLVDTSKDIVSTKSLDTEKYMMDILISKKNMVLFNVYMGTVQIDFSQYAKSSFNNESLLGLKPLIYFILLTSYIILLIMEPLRYLFSAIPLAIVGSIRGGAGAKERLSFAKIYLLALYAQTVPTLIQSFNRSAQLIKSQFLLVYAALFFSVFLLARGVHYIEEVA